MQIDILVWSMRAFVVTEFTIVVMEGAHNWSEAYHMWHYPLVIEIYPEMVMKPVEAYQNILPGVF